MNLFYAADIDNSKTILLDEQESRHSRLVLRLDIGNSIHVTDGKGNLYTGKIKKNDKKHVLVEVTNVEMQYQKMPYRLHIGIAPTKQMDRMEWFAEKATEIGISEITPLLSFHSERKTIKPERLEKIVISAMKQSFKAYKPVIHEMTAFQQFIESNSSEHSFIAHCNYPLSHKFYTSIQPFSSYTVLIGPEGDFSREEVNMAIKEGYKEISLGKNRLRTETAGILTCHSVALKHV